MCIMYFPALLPVSKKSKKFANIQRTCEANFIGSFISWQGQEHMEIVDAFGIHMNFTYFLEDFNFKFSLKNCVHVCIGQNSIKAIHIEFFHYSSLNR